LGKAGLTYRDRFVQSKFTTLDRFNHVEFSRDYNISNQDQPNDQSLREIGVTLQPIDEISISSNAGFLRNGNDFSSDRFNNILRFTDQKKYSIEYNLDYVKTNTSDIRSSWFRHKANAYYSFWKMKSGIDFLAEDKTDLKHPADTLLSTSLKYFDYAPYLQLIDFEGFSVLTRYGFRDDYLPDNGLLIKESRSLTPSFELNYNGLREFSTNIVFTYRSKKYEDAFKQKGLLDNETILIRSRSKFLFWDPLLNGDLYYEVSTQKSARLTKSFCACAAGDRQLYLPR
jgi:hypothetical protein